MDLVDVIVLGIALSADAFAVTISNSFAYSRESNARKALMPVFFGLFQGIMPLAGYYLGGLAAELIERYAGIITLVILGVVGGNMVREGVESIRSQRKEDSSRANAQMAQWEREADERVASGRVGRDAEAVGGANSNSGSSAVQPAQQGHLTIPMLLFQALATAIDAFAVGVSLRAMGVEIVSSASIIALTTALCCTVALFIGRKLGDLLGDRAQVVGGVVLILIGLRAFLS